MKDKPFPLNKEENIRYRIKLILEAEENIELQEIVKKKCREDIIYFFNVFLYTYKPKSIGNEEEPLIPHFPFITYNFQDSYIKNIVECVENGEDNFTEKSREMGYTWMILGIAVWGLLFKGWSGLIGSYKESLVDRAGDMDSLFERLRYMFERLPNWIKPEDLESKYMNIFSKSLGAGIAGDSGDAFGTGGRRKWVFLDEFALWRNDSIAFRKTKDIANCRIFGGTPEGKNNIYGKVMTNHPDYSSLIFKKFRLHWSEHPLKTKDWYEKQKQTRTKKDLAQELDINYDDSVSNAVYEDFERLVKFDKCTHNSNYKLYTSWDFGRDSNVVQLWQKDFETNSLFLIKSFRRVGRNIKHFASLVVGIVLEEFDYTNDDIELMKEIKELSTLYSGHFGDPYNSNSKTTNALQTIKEILAEFGIYLSFKTGTTIESRITLTKFALSRITINYEQNIDCIESMRQSRYPKIKEGNEYLKEKTKPIHDDNSHHRTAFEYFIDNEPKRLEISSKKKNNGKFINRITGEVEKVRK